MDIAITGASGFLGSALTRHLCALGHAMRPVPRAPHAHTFASDPLAGAGAVIHLAGEPVAQRWTSAAKQRIRDSRVTGTQNLVGLLSRLDPRPRVLLCSSAIGYYGSRGDEVLEETAGSGTGFLAEVCREWEAAARAAESHGIRVVCMRTGLVLSREGGALPRMLPAFRFALGGPLGGGRHWMSWIHLDDLLRLFSWAIENDSVRGPLNVTSPNPVRNSEFTRSLSKALRRPAFWPVPALALRLLFGEMAEILLASQRVVPAAALAHGFEFQHTDLLRSLRRFV
jgi:uncharacterized protein (TIGR01777 family)